MREFNEINDAQRSKAWFLARCGRITASRAGDMLARVKSGEAAARRDLRIRLALERLTGQPQDEGYVSKDMERGIELEAEARAKYEALTGVIVREVGFLAHSTLMAGGSPDGVIGDFDGLVELKAPRSATHLNYLRAQVVPPEYLPQLIALLWLTGAQYCDFFSYDPRFPPRLQTFLVRLYAKDVDLAAYELAVRLFLGEVETEAAGILALAARESFDEVDARVAAEIRRDAHDHD